MNLNSLLARGPWALVGALLFAGIVGYTVFVGSPYLLGPSVSVTTPAQHATVSTPTVAVSGKTERVAIVTLNDQPIPLLEDGTFSVERAFPPGYTVLMIRARDRFGREETRVIRFLNTYNPPSHGKEESS